MLETTTERPEPKVGDAIEVWSEATLLEGDPRRAAIAGPLTLAPCWQRTDCNLAAGHDGPCNEAPAPEQRIEVPAGVSFLVPPGILTHEYANLVSDGIDMLVSQAGDKPLVIVMQEPGWTLLSAPGRRVSDVVLAALAWEDHPTPANIGALHAAIARYRGA